MKTLSSENTAFKQAQAGAQDADRQAREVHNLRNEVQMLREEKQRMLDGEASARQKVGMRNTQI